MADPVIITSDFSAGTPSAPLAITSSFSAGSPSAPLVITGDFTAGSPSAPLVITSSYSAGSPAAHAVVATNWSQPNGPISGYQQSDDEVYPGGVVSLYELGSANGFPIFRSGTGPFNIGYQVFLTAELSAGMLNFEWCYQLLLNGTLLGFWREDNDGEVTTPSPDLVTTWVEQGLGTEVAEGTPIFVPLYGPLASPAVLTASFTPSTPASPLTITSTFSPGTPASPLAITSSFTPGTPADPVVILP